MKVYSKTIEDGQLLTINGVVARDNVVTIESTGVGALTNATTDKLAGIAKGNDGTKTTIQVIDSCNEFTVIAYEGVESGIFALNADIDAGKFVPLYLAADGSELVIDSDTGSLTEVAKVIGRNGDVYTIKILPTAKQL